MMWMTLKRGWISSPWASEEGERKGSGDVQGYQRKVQDLPLEHTECALSTAFVTEALGDAVHQCGGAFSAGLPLWLARSGPGDHAVSPLNYVALLLFVDVVDVRAGLRY